MSSRASKIWEQEVGIPPSAGSAGAAPEIRKYILQQANYLKGRIRLYLRVMDANGKVFRVFPIGPMVSFGRPEPQVDKASNLHVLYQYGPSAFSYTVFSPQGDLLVRRTYDYVGSRPRLGLDEAGDITVLGGVRRFAATDLPKPPGPPADDSPPSTPQENSKTPDAPKTAKP